MNKKLLAVAVSGALAAPMAAHAIKYKLSGQVNRAIVYQDDGTATDTQFNDNVSSGTRVRLVGSQDIGSGMKAGFNWEWQNSSNPNSQPLKASDGGDSQSLRKAEVWFSGHWGKVSLGQGDGAGNGATESDLSNTWNVAYHGRSSFGGAAAWRTSMGNDLTTGGGTAVHGKLGAANALTHGATFSEFDAFSRYDRLRYDTPAIGPVTLSASVGQNSKWEIAGRTSTSLAGGQLSGAIFYGQNNTVESRWGGSFSYLFSQGTNFTFAYAQSKNSAAGSPTSDVVYFKLGHRWGNNAVAVGWGRASDVVKGYDDSGWQLAFNHNIPKAKIDIYAGYHNNELSTPAGVPGVSDISAFVVGTKVKFD